MIKDQLRIEVENLKAQMKKLFGLQFSVLTLDFNGEIELSSGNNPNKAKTDFWTESMVTQEYLNILLPKSFNSIHNSDENLQVPLTPLNNEGLPLFKDVDKNSNFVEKAELIEYGRKLSSNDNINVKIFLSDFISLTLLPFMERNIHHLNEQVASARRGINRFFNAGRKYFGNSSKQIQQRNIIATIDGLNRYSYQSAESQMRRLADLSFMLCDFKFAYSVYDNIKKDFNSHDQDKKYYAGTQGMIVLCLLMYNSVKLNIDTIMENSILNYNKCKSNFYAQKATFSYNFLLKQLNQYKKVTQAFLRITNEESNVLSGLFLEQTSYCYLKLKPKMIRKHAFHLILAGHRYSRCGNREHAYRCYFSALKIYKDKNWTLIDDHINFTLGRQAFHLADLDKAVDYFLKLLHGSKQSANQQSAYMKEFLYIYRQYMEHKNPENDKDIINLSIPNVDDNSIKVLLFDVAENQREDNLVTDENQQDDEWEVLDNLVSLENINMNCSSFDNNQNTCTIGEPIYVVITLNNPMKIPLELDKLMLNCELIPTNGETVQSINSSYENDNNFIHYQNYSLQQINHIKLNPNSQEKIKIVVIPKIEGVLKIQGIKFLLFNLVNAIHLFEKKGKRLNSTKEQRMNVMYAEDKSLTFTVTPPMPLLDVVFHSKPTSVFAGETCKMILEINNKGNCTLKNLKLVMNQNSLVYIGSPEMINDELYSKTNSDNVLENNEINNKLTKQKVFDILLPLLNDGTRGLASGTTTLVPIWIHFNQIGKISQRFLFNYYSEVNSKSYTRSLKYMINIQVLPSLRINAFTRKSSSRLNEFILGIEVENLLNDTSVNLEQISVISPNWKMRNITTDLSNEDDYVIEPHQTSLVYYKLVQLTDNEKVKSENILPEFYSCKKIENFLLGEKNEEQDHKIILYSDHIKCLDNSIVLMKNEELEFFILKSKYSWRMDKLNSQYPHIPKKDIPNLFTLYQTDDVDLLLFWENVNNKTRCYQFIPGINLGIQQSPLQYSEKFRDNASKSVNMITTKALFSQTAQKKKELLNSLLKNKNIRDNSPLRVNIKSKNIIYHNFSQSKTCIVPVSLFIKNCSYNKLAYFKINMTSKKVQSDSSFDHDNTEEFIWIGKISSNGYLKPNEEKLLKFNAAISKYGIYNLNKWNIKVKTQQYSPDITITNEDIVFDEANIKDTENLYLQSSTNVYNVNIISE